MSGETYIVGDAGNAFDYDYTDANGDPVTLTGQTVQLIFRPPAGALKTRTATLIAGPTGGADEVARYILLATDFDEVGVWFREFHTDGPAFVDSTEPVPFYVGPRLSAT